MPKRLIIFITLFAFATPAIAGSPKEDCLEFARYLNGWYSASNDKHDSKKYFYKKAAKASHNIDSHMGIGKAERDRMGTGIHRKTRYNFCKSYGVRFE